MIKEIQSQNEWNAWLGQQMPNTFLQSWEWGQAAVINNNRPLYLGYFDNKGMQQAAALVLPVMARRGTHFLIPHGPIFATNAHKKMILRELIAHLRQADTTKKYCALRIAPLLTTSPESTQLFRSLGFRPAPLHVHAELTWVRDIPESDEALRADMRKTTRHAIRKAEQVGVRTAIHSADSILDTFWPLYEETGSRHGFVLHSKEAITRQLQAFGETNSVFGVSATYKSEVVAAAIIFMFGTTAFYYHGASRAVPKVSPTQLLQYEAMREARSRGARLYNFWGIAPDDQPNHPFAGITVFKKGFGGHAMDYMHAQDLSLSWRYWLLWLIETLRRWRRGF